MLRRGMLPPRVILALVLTATATLAKYTFSAALMISVIRAASSWVFEPAQSDGRGCTKNEL
jgi:hypothetical protein